MDRSLVYSLLLHTLLALFIIVRLSFFDKPQPLGEPPVFTVELLPISQMTNVPTAPKMEPKPLEEKHKEKPKQKPKEQTPPPPKPQAASKPKAEEPSEPKPKEKAEVKKPEPMKEKEPKKEEKKPKSEDKEKTDLDFESSMKNLMKEQPKQQEVKKPAPPAPAPPAVDPYDQMKAALAQDAMNPYNPNIPVSLSEKDGIRQQFYQCWTPLTGAKNADLLTIKVEILLDRTGYVRNYKLLTTSPPAGVDQALFAAAQQRAVMAIQNEACRRLRQVPSPEKYGGENGWWRIELNFDHRNYY